jgi:hypothetical protein
MNTRKIWRLAAGGAGRRARVAVAPGAHAWASLAGVAKWLRGRGARLDFAGA